MLIPSTAAGSIIGKGGMTIAQLQRDTGTNIKLSKANDFYPGEFSHMKLMWCLMMSPFAEIARLVVARSIYLYVFASLVTWS